MPTDSGTNDILSLGFLHYTTAVSREMSDEPYISKREGKQPHHKYFQKSLTPSFHPSEALPKLQDSKPESDYFLVLYFHHP